MLKKIREGEREEPSVNHSHSEEKKAALLKWEAELLRLLKPSKPQPQS
jgi:hypothetical protein